MRRVIIESPYGADVKLFTRYARLCLRDSISRGEAPFASHLLYPGSLEENILEERRLGIELGFTWWRNAEAVIFYRDFGMSRGMISAMCKAQWEQMPIINRWLIPLDHYPGEPLPAAKRIIARKLGLTFWSRFFGAGPLPCPIPAREVETTPENISTFG